MVKQIYFDEKNQILFQEEYSKCHYIQENIKPLILKNGIVIPPMPLGNGYNKVEAGVLDSNKNFCKMSACRDNLEFINFKSPDNVKKDERKVVYLGILFNHYGHFLLESTARLYYVLNNKLDDYYLCFSVSCKEFPKFVSDFLDLCGINRNKIIFVNESTQFSEVIVPPLSTKYGINYNDNFLIPFRRAAENIKPAEYEKVYLSRKSWKGVAQCIGEDKLEKVFNDNGFVSIEMEKLSLKEQISVIKGAKEFAGIYGSAFHNIIFSSNKPKVIMLYRTSLIDMQHIINEAIGAIGYPIRAYNNLFPVNHAHGPFIMGMSPYMKDFFDEHKFKYKNFNCININTIKQFIDLYIKTYNIDAYKTELKKYGNTQIDAEMFLEIMNILSFSLLKYYLYRILSKITFGRMRKKLKQKYLNLKNIKDCNNIQCLLNSKQNSLV